MDAFGSIYVTGQTTSANFPTTVGAFDTTHNGGPDPFNGGNDAFVLKFSTTTGLPATLTLNPPTSTNPVDSQHCVTATVEDASGRGVADVVVRFEVTGAVNTTGSATTDANVEATFCYVGPPLPGADTITAFVDNGGLSAVAMKTWVLPATTPLCEITNGGWIIAENGDRSTLGGNAKANASARDAGGSRIHGPWTSATYEHALDQRARYCLRLEPRKHLRPGDDRRVRCVELQNQRAGPRCRQERGYVPVAHGRLQLRRAAAGRRQRPDPPQVENRSGRSESDFITLHFIERLFPGQRSSYDLKKKRRIKSSVFIKWVCFVALSDVSSV